MDEATKDLLATAAEKSTAAIAVIQLEFDKTGAATDWVLLDVNPTFTSWNNKTPDECRGRRFYADLHPEGDHKWLSAYCQAATEGRAIEFEDFSPEVGRYLRIRVTPLDQEGHCLLFMVPRNMGLAEDSIDDYSLLRYDVGPHESAMLDALFLDYTFIDICDLLADTMRPIKGNFFAHRATAMKVLGSDNPPYSAWIEWCFNNIVVKKESPEFLDILNPRSLMAALDRQQRIAYRHRTLPNAAGNEYFEIQAVKVYSNEKTYQVIVGYRPIDQLIAEERQMQARLEDALDRAQQAAHAKSTFLFNMSHDIRTPMNAIIGFTDLLETHAGDPERVADYTAKIKGSSEYLLSLVNDILEMARIESGAVALDETVIDAGQINDSIYYVFMNQMAEKHIRFTRSMNVRHHYLWCDVTKLKKILLNVLSNAYKYTLEGGSVSFSIEELPCDDPQVAPIRTVIRDTGIGMSRAFLATIFESFSREKTSTESGQGGTGLGMAIVKQTVDLMGGTIDVESEQGVGTTFTIVLPHRIATAAEYAALVAGAGDAAGGSGDGADGRASREREFFRGKRLLLAEDNDLNAEIAQTILEDAGFAVDRAADGVECVGMLEAAPAGRYNAILMDIQMPVMDGYKACEVIRGLDDKALASIPIVAMTANAFAEDKRRALSKGMNAHVAKPIDIAELHQTLVNLL